MASLRVRLLRWLIVPILLVNTLGRNRDIHSGLAFSAAIMSLTLALPAMTIEMRGVRLI